MKKMTAPLYPDAPPTPTPAVPGSFDALNPEIWGRIVGFLVPAAPKPLSGMTKQEYSYLANNRLEAMQELYKSLPDTSEAGTTKRRDIRAGDLAVLMRTSLVSCVGPSYQLLAVADNRLSISKRPATYTPTSSQTIFPVSHSPPTSPPPTPR